MATQETPGSIANHSHNTPSTNKPWTARTKSKRYRLVDCILIDPKDGQIYPHVTLDLKDGLIHQMTKLTSPPSPNDDLLSHTRDGVDAIARIPCTGKYVLPGLIDCHVHLATPPGESGLSATMTQDPQTNLLRQPYLAHEMLKRGFTSVRDCGGASRALKEAIEEGLHPGPRLSISGHGISQTGGHGDLRSAKDAEYACCGGNSRGLGRVADGVDQCLRAAREELRQGADFVKIMVSGGVVSPTDKLADLQYTPEEIRAFACVAAGAGTYVSAHAYTPSAISNAISNGVSGIEHGNFLDEPTAKFMAERGAFLTPTPTTYSAMALPAFSHFLPPDIAQKNQQVLRAGLKSLQIADAAGVTMCFGTDLLGPMQVQQSAEFGLRKKAGLSNLKILQSATVNAAMLLREEGRLGRLKEGSVADLGVWRRNPLEDVGVLERPERELLCVVQGGRVVVSRWSKVAVDGAEGGGGDIE